MNGILTGGWNFVLAAYLVSGTILIAYSIHAINGLRKAMAASNTKGL